MVLVQALPDVGVLSSFIGVGTDHVDTKYFWIHSGSRLRSLAGTNQVDTKTLLTSDFLFFPFPCLRDS